MDGISACLGAFLPLNCRPRRKAGLFIMGKQHNKVEKRRRRANYLKRKREAVKAKIALGKKSVSKKTPAKKVDVAADAGEDVKAAPAKKAAAKKAPAKKAAAKKAPAKKAAAKKKAATKKAAKKKAAPEKD